MVTEAERAFHNAVSFHEGARRCGEMVPHPTNENAHFVMQLPEIVCTAFAAELYLKSLLLNRGESARSEHRLLELYTERLNEAERDAIARRYDERRNARKELMLKELTSVSKAFVEWRYSHESMGAIDFGALSTFAKSAYLAIRDLIPQWEVDPYLHERIVERRHSLAFVGIVGGDPEQFNRVMAESIMGLHFGSGKPQPDVIKGEEHNLSLIAPTLYFESKSAAFYVNVRRGSDTDDSAADEPIK